ncbi:MAG TPA: gamma-glutamyl-gamma-aminobutyrate hydrolase family protein [Phycisphaerae bacterium]|nr:gamma-glutamyl-gamma-aminobutyrate hydrolase family protein [Phycisphaerae bacterium]
MELEILIVQTGSTYPEVVNAAGDYDRWFLTALNAKNLVVTVVDSLVDQLPEPGLFDAMILTGSSCSATEMNPLLDAFCEWIRRLADADVPTLGVCFGHQIMAKAFGGCVQRHAMGRQFGTVVVTATDAGRRDFLFNDLDETFDVHSCHEDVCTQLPENATLLARSPKTINQSFAIGEFLRAVQFHPEASTSIISQLHDSLVARGQLARREPGFQSAAAESIGKRILANFIQFAMQTRHHAH